ncbi:P-loop containing nucleoside triphosphate hydrolase protein [Podospora appendiculata]|uniref:P-loop containing nucleoside triphosphate hydrolase protein n=1 Tax=Podospora appendiculata TaxID=314037 RepID=A0AAE1CDW8_9PEZI|nr:P-loop containing nucleoside triphosphate hydrolase protein [Podospora appendiculata]
MSSVVSRKPNVKWNDVAGLNRAKDELQRAIVFPMRFPSLFDDKRKSSSAVLLYGPPGTGKSYLAKALATEVHCSLYNISSEDLMSKWLGDSKKLVRHLFWLARENKPSIIFIDDIDVFCANRDGDSEHRNEHTAHIKTELLIQLDGVKNDNTGVVVLAATSSPWLLDPAVRRRFDLRIYILLPDSEARIFLFRIHSGKWGQSLSESDLAELAKLTDDFREILSGSEQGMYEIYSPHELGAMQLTWVEIPNDNPKAPSIELADFIRVLGDGEAKSSIGCNEPEKYADWTRSFGIDGNTTTSNMAAGVN